MYESLYSEEELQHVEEEEATSAAAAKNLALQCVVLVVGFLLFEQKTAFVSLLLNSSLMDNYIVRMFTSSFKTPRSQYVYMHS